MTIVADDHERSRRRPSCVLMSSSSGIPGTSALVYGALHDFARDYPFDPDREDYLVHITTGTHVAQICLFLLTESRHFPARLLQTSPPQRQRPGTPGPTRIIDLDLSRYDRLASRFQQRAARGPVVPQGRHRHPERRLQPAHRAHRAGGRRLAAPAPADRPTGAGKSQLARRIYELKKARRQVDGRVRRGELRDRCAATPRCRRSSATSGRVHRRAARPRRAAAEGRRRRAVPRRDRRAGRRRAGDAAARHRGQTFLPRGRRPRGDERLPAHRRHEPRPRRARSTAGGSARTCSRASTSGRSGCPGLRERPEDIEPNLDHELANCAGDHRRPDHHQPGGAARFLAFATSAEAIWTGNFRDFNAAVVRMATLAPGGRISHEVVQEEIQRLRASWRDGIRNRINRHICSRQCWRPRRSTPSIRSSACNSRKWCGCAARRARSPTPAGALFAASRTQKAAPNDADRLRKYLARFGLEWSGLRDTAARPRA